MGTLKPQSNGPSYGNTVIGTLAVDGLAILNVKVHQSTVSVPITVLLYDGPLLCGFNVPIKGYKKLSCRRETARRLVSLKILLSHSRSLEVIRNDTVQ